MGWLWRQSPVGLNGISSERYVFVLQGQKDLKTNSWLYHQAMSLLERNLLRKRAGPHIVLTC